MHELIYSTYGITKTKKRFPSAIVTDASDYIHPERSEVEIEDSLEDEFRAYSIREGFAEECLGFQLMLQSLKFPEREPGQHGRIRARLQKWIDEAKIRA